MQTITKLLLPIISLVLLSAIGLHQKLGSSSSITISSIPQGQFIVDDNHNLIANYSNKQITNNDLSKIAHEIISYQETIINQYGYFTDIKIELVNNQITNPCNLFRPIGQYQFLTKGISFNFANNQIKIPQCLDKIQDTFYVYDNYGLNFENNGISREGYQQFFNLANLQQQRGYAFKGFRLNLSQNSPVMKQDLEFLSELNQFDQLTLILNNMQLQDGKFELPTDIQIKKSFQLGLSGNNLNDFSFLDNPVIKTSRKFRMDISHNQFDNSSNWSMFESIYQRNALEQLIINLYDNSQVPPKVLLQLQHNYPYSDIRINTQDPNYQTFTDF